MGDDQAPALRVGVVDAHGRAVRVPGLGRWLARVAPRRARGTLTIALVSDARIRELNRKYRGKDYATDVLSFPPARPRYGLRSRPTPGLRHDGAGAHLGDVVIARGVAARQAREHGHAPTVELKVLALHGLLHLLGYDHETDAGRMRRVEARLRRQGGLPAGLIERGGSR